MKITYVTLFLANLMLLAFAIYGCTNSAPIPHHTADTTQYTSNAPDIQKNVTTQKAAVEGELAGDKTAGGLVQSADGKVTAVNADKPDARLSDAHNDLVKANQTLSLNEIEQQKTIDSQQATMKMMADHITADDGLYDWGNMEAQKAATALNDKEAALAAQAKAEAFINAHKDDFWGQGVHRFFAGLSRFLIITLGVVVIGVGVLGAIYGLPKITTPALSIGGKILNGIQLVLGYVWKFLITAIPWAGHEIYNLWEDLHILKATATVAKVATPIASPTVPAPSTPVK